jgi:hypothetical protein
LSDLSCHTSPVDILTSKNFDSRLNARVTGVTTVGSGNLRQSLFIDVGFIIEMQTLGENDMGFAERRGGVERCSDRTGLFTRLGVAAD